MKDGKTFSQMLGTVAANVCLICLAACICGIMIALTWKFLGWIF